jgi:hypothetical protein
VNEVPDSLKDPSFRSRVHGLVEASCARYQHSAAAFEAWCSDAPINTAYVVMSDDHVDEEKAATLAPGTVAEVESLLARSEHGNQHMAKCDSSDIVMSISDITRVGEGSVNDGSISASASDASVLSRSDGHLGSTCTTPRSGGSAGDHGGHKQGLGRQVRQRRRHPANGPNPGFRQHIASNGDNNRARRDAKRSGQRGPPAAFEQIRCDFDVFRHTVRLSRYVCCNAFSACGFIIRKGSLQAACPLPPHPITACTVWTPSHVFAQVTVLLIGTSLRHGSWSVHRRWAIAVQHSVWCQTCMPV